MKKLRSVVWLLTEGFRRLSWSFVDSLHQPSYMHVHVCFFIFTASYLSNERTNKQTIKLTDWLTI